MSGKNGSNGNGNGNGHGKLTAAGKQLGGATGHGWLPGQSGNPGGRRPSLKNAVVKVCGEDGNKLAEFWHCIAWGTDEEFQTMFGKSEKRTVRDRMEAAKELADRGYGKPVQAVEMTGADGGPLDIRDVRDDLARKLAGLAARSGTGHVVSKPH